MRGEKASKTFRQPPKLSVDNQEGSPRLLWKNCQVGWLGKLQWLSICLGGKKRCRRCCFPSPPFFSVRQLRSRLFSNSKSVPHVEVCLCIPGWNAPVSCASALPAGHPSLQEEWPGQASSFHPRWTCIPTESLWHHGSTFFFGVAAQRREGQ